MTITAIPNFASRKIRHRYRAGILAVAAAMVLTLAPDRASAYAEMIGGIAAQSDFKTADYSGTDAGFVVLSIDLHDSGVGIADIFLDAESKDERTLTAFMLKTGMFASKSSNYQKDGIEGTVVVRALPPGDYTLTRFLGTAGSNCGHGSMLAGFGIPFSVKAGQTTYLGNFRFEPLTWSNWFGAICSAGGYFVVGDMQARDMAAAKTANARLADSVTAQIPDTQSLNLPLFRSVPDPKPQPSPTALDTQNTLNGAFGYLHKDNAKARDMINAALQSGDLWQHEIALAHGWLGGLDIEAHDYNGAVKELSEAVRLDPLVDTAWGNRGTVRYLLGDLEGTVSDEKAALHLSQRNVIWLMKLADAEAALHQDEMAIVHYDDAVSIRPDDPLVYLRRGNGKAVLGRYEEAMADLDHAIKLADSPAAFYFAARCIAGVRAGRGDAAMADCDHAVKADPKSATEGLDTRGYAHLLRGETAAAIADFNASLAIAPAQASPLFGRAIAEQKSGDDAASRSDFEAARRSSETIGNYVKADYGVVPEAAGKTAPDGL